MTKLEGAIEKILERHKRKQLGDDITLAGPGKNLAKEIYRKATLKPLKKKLLIMLEGLDAVLDKKDYDLIENYILGLFAISEAYYKSKDEILGLEEQVAEVGGREKFVFSEAPEINANFDRLIQTTKKFANMPPELKHMCAKLMLSWKGVVLKIYEVPAGGERNSILIMYLKQFHGVLEDFKAYSGKHLEKEEREIVDCILDDALDISSEAAKSIRRARNNFAADVTLSIGIAFSILAITILPTLHIVGGIKVQGDLWDPQNPLLPALSILIFSAGFVVWLGRYQLKRRVRIWKKGVRIWKMGRRFKTNP